MFLNSTETTWGFFSVDTTNEEKIQKLVNTGRDALQAYFDTIFSPGDLEQCLQDNKTPLTKDEFKFTGDQIRIVYPSGRRRHHSLNKI